MDQSALEVLDSLEDSLKLATIDEERPMLTQERLKELLHYSPETGEWKWLEDRSPKVRAGDPTGLPGKHKYCVIGVEGKMHGAHRLAWLYMTGSWPEEEIDHIDRDSRNNRWANLRSATRAQNGANRDTRSPIGVKGVRKLSRSSKRPFEASISVGGKLVYLGVFETAELASAAYLEAAGAHFGEFASVV